MSAWMKAELVLAVAEEKCSDGDEQLSNCAVNCKFLERHVVCFLSVRLHDCSMQESLHWSGMPYSKMLNSTKNKRLCAVKPIMFYVLSHIENNLCNGHLSCMSEQLQHVCLHVVIN